MLEEVGGEVVAEKVAQVVPAVDPSVSEEAGISPAAAAAGKEIGREIEVFVPPPGAATTETVPPRAFTLASRAAVSSDAELKPVEFGDAAELTVGLAAELVVVLTVALAAELDEVFTAADGAIGAAVACTSWEKFSRIYLRESASGSAEDMGMMLNFFEWGVNRIKVVCACRMVWTATLRAPSVQKINGKCEQ